MNIILNGLINPQQIITFNNVPTILKIDSSGDGDRAKLEISVTNSGGEATKDYYITINDSTVTSTWVESNAVGSVFWLASSLGLSYSKAQCYYLMQALLNTSLANNYNIYMDNQVYGSTTSKVIVEAKEIGSKYNFSNIDTNIPNWSINIINDGSSSDLLTNTKVVLDIYAESDASKQTEIGANSKILPHIVTLEKNYYKDGINFDLSPVLSNLTDNGNITQYNITAAYIKNGQYTTIGELSHNYAANGYSVNQGRFFIPKFSGWYLAQNVSRGVDKGYYNNTTLYYLNGEEITVSFYCYDFSSKNIIVEYYDSAMNHIVSSINTIKPDKSLYTFRYTPTNDDAYYMIVRLPNGEQIRYTNVKPLRYGNMNEYQTLYWYNSYGGVSFFPFTAKREEERESDKVLYRKQNFNLYNDTIKSMNKVYSMDNEYNVTLTTHYMDKDGIYSLYDLMNSYEVWTEVNGVKYEIIIDQVKVTETATSGVWQGTVTYKYSSPDRY